MSELYKPTICIELHYLPGIPYLALLAGSRELVLEQYENYQKRSFRNKTILAAANGELTLGIPLEKGKHQRQPIRETRIAYQLPWQNQHWQSIQSAYGNAPFFDEYAPEIQPFYRKSYTWLFDWNLALLEKIKTLLQLDFSLSFTENYQAKCDPCWFDARNQILPKKTSSTFSWNYQPPVYPQVFMGKHGFLPDLSILDLLFCTGPEATLLLESACSFNR